MQSSRDIFINKLNSNSKYTEVSESISAVLDILNEENEEIDTSFIDCLLYNENQNQGIRSSDSLRARRACHVIKDHIKRLVIASIKEQITAKGEFRIPDDGENDYLFEEEIIMKYEIAAISSDKDEWDDYASLGILVDGSLKNIFEKHECAGIRIDFYFDAEEASDYFVIIQPHHTDSEFRKIELCGDGNIPVDNLENLANELLANQNKHLMFHDIKYSSKKG